MRHPLVTLIVIFCQKCFFFTRFIRPCYFIILCLCIKERIPKRMLFTACRNSKFFRFYGLCILAVYFQYFEIILALKIILNTLKAHFRRGSEVLICRRLFIEVALIYILVRRSLSSYRRPNLCKERRTAAGELYIPQES